MNPKFARVSMEGVKYQIQFFCDREEHCDQDYPPYLAISGIMIISEMSSRRASVLLFSAIGLETTNKHDCTTLIHLLAKVDSETVPYLTDKKMDDKENVDILAERILACPFDGKDGSSEKKLCRVGFSS